VLYEMLTGRAPFEGQTPSAVVGMHVRVDPLPPRRVRPEIPAALEAIVMRCLQKDPRDRYQRAAQLAAALRRFHASGSGIAATLRRFHASGSGITATLLPSRTTDELEPQPQRGGRTSTRRDRRPPRRRTSLALVVVLLVVAAGLMAPFLVRSEGTPSPQPTARPALAAPMGLAAKASCDGFLKAKVRLTWFPGEARSTDGYAVYRSESSEGPYRSIELLSGRSTTATTDPHLNTSTTYRYVVRATSDTRMSPYSQSVQADTPGFCLF
jgi:serine/threonine protein kinase